MVELITIGFIFLAFLILLKIVAWTIQAGFFILALPFKILGLIIGIVVTLIVVPLVIIPTLLVVALPLLPIFLVVIGIILLVKLL